MSYLLTFLMVLVLLYYFTIIIDIKKVKRSVQTKKELRKFIFLPFSWWLKDLTKFYRNLK